MCGICGDGADEDLEDELERNWLKCEKCDQWYHADCLGFSNDDEVSMYFECEHCR